MDSELADFLASAKRLTEESVVWGDAMPLRIAYYLGAGHAPLQYVSSVRAVVFREDSVLVVRDAESHFHTLPGGRREAEETPEETLHREVLEETGWTLTHTCLLGFMHFHHLAPRPDDYAYPYPDFLWLLYAAQADEYVPGARIPGEYERESRFRPIAEARTLLVEQGHLMLLDAAVESRRNAEQHE